MSKQIQIPDIGSDEVTVTEVMVKVGDTITADQSIINVEGDKASMEVPAPEAGVVKEVLVKVGDKVTTGTPMLVLESADAAAPAPASAAPAPAAAPAGAAGSVQVTAPMPGKVVAVKASVGQAVKKGEVVLVLEAMKMENDIVAPEDGTIASINVANGDAVESGAVLATLN